MTSEIHFTIYFEARTKNKSPEKLCGLQWHEKVKRNNSNKKEEKRKKFMRERKMIRMPVLGRSVVARVYISISSDSSI